MLTAGRSAPEFTLTNQNETEQSLAALRGHPVLVYFYPRADTPGCTQQACGLRDIAAQVGDTVILGISPDKPTALGRFRDKYSLNFELLSDIDHSVAEAYGVWKEKKNYGKTYMGIERSAFLVGADGSIRNAWYKISPKDTPTRLLEALAE
ncbi:MAG: thioredoxin-dependent thiol peroxidase [Ilumatobacteraceae bacterium]